ncbi:MAG TPA: hypothetical protein VE443_10630, partial [Beijerinckiaceae bacterium]|nr:hypothetical protein [Beijerinckiaceae bacterium]
LIALANTTTPYPGRTGPDGRPNNCYPSFGLLLSTDGGRSWEDPRSGRRLQLPIDAGQNGPSYHPLERAVTEIGERCMHNWLSGFLYKSGESSWDFGATTNLAPTARASSRYPTRSGS